jgi:hypothetical protein
MSPFNQGKREFVSVDARLDDLKNQTRSYEMLSRDSGKTMDDLVTPSTVSPLSPVAAKSSLRSPSRSTADHGAYKFDGRQTPDYFGSTARYHTPMRSFSSPKPPQTVTWDMNQFTKPTQPHQDSEHDDYMNPLGMNRI